jgi:hypothetical protein
MKLCVCLYVCVYVCPAPRDGFVYKKIIYGGITPTQSPPGP